ncbi:sulfatase-like hydrolase/transferase [Kribbella sp. CA-245084]|uniref:sulfatase-like hydrolase/transferase n=1 Tax=Kribbella sp. CA-245084 TaxID=3239940 RepID=UPI003D8D5694
MKPSILLIVSDQHRLDCVGASGSYPVSTPRLDALAAQGATFSSAYTPIPLCTPARQSLLTGRRPETTGNLWNYDLGPRIPALDPASYSWPRELQKLGYRSRYLGKWHVNPDHDPTDFGYDDWVPLDAYDRWRAQQYPDSSLLEDWFGEVDPVPTADSRTHWFADQTADFIREATASGQPWHARLDFLEPHLPCQPTAEFADRFPVDAIPQWRDFEDPLERKPYIQRQQLLNWGVEDYTWEDWAPIVARYYAVIAQLDDAIGRVLDAVDEAGAAADTLVVYTTDHGDMCGSHGMMDKHYVMYDNVVRVPMIMSWPGMIAEGNVIDGFAYNTLDLPPTISTLTGIPAPPGAQGLALFDHVDTGLIPTAALEAREQVVSTYNGQQFGLFIQRMIRTRSWKYVWNPTDVDELYNLDDDPEELVNRIGDDSSTRILADLRKRLYEQLLHDEDSFVENEWMARQLLTGRKLPTRT